MHENNHITIFFFIYQQCVTCHRQLFETKQLLKLRRLFIAITERTHVTSDSSMFLDSLRQDFFLGLLSHDQT